MDLRTAVLIAAVLAPTDAAAVFTVARGLRLPSRLQTLIEAESGLNDAPVVVLVVLLSTTVGSEMPAWLIPIVVVGRAGGRPARRCARRALRPVAAAPAGPSCIGALPGRGDRAADARLRAGRRPAHLRLRCGVRRRADPGRVARCRTAARCSASSRGWRGRCRSGCSSCSACWRSPAAWRSRPGIALLAGALLLVVARPAERRGLAGRRSCVPGGSPVGPGRSRCPGSGSRSSRGPACAARSPSSSRPSPWGRTCPTAS